jgi:hypothetical protein
MSKRTLPDELRSVLLAHAMEAPEAAPTVRRVLSATVAPEELEPTSRRRWLLGPLLAVAAVLLLSGLIAGVVALDQHAQSGRTSAEKANAGPGDVNAVISQGQANGSTGGQLNGLGSNVPASRPPASLPPRNNIAPGEAGGVPPNPPPPAGLNCGRLQPGSRLDIGSAAKARLAGMNQDLYLYDFRCVLASGRRSASTVAVYAQVRGVVQQRAVLIAADRGGLVDFVGSDDRTLVVQLMDPAGNLVREDFTTSDGTHFSHRVDQLAPGCTPSDLTARIAPADSVSSVEGPQPYAVQLTKHSDGLCVLAGYLTVTSSDDSRSRAVPTLRGTAGGTGSEVPEIVQLARGTTVAAMIEASSRPGCAVSNAVAVALPGGLPLGVLPAGIALCGAQVHPIVPNDRGSD